VQFLFSTTFGLKFSPSYLTFDLKSLVKLLDKETSRKGGRTGFWLTLLILYYWVPTPVHQRGVQILWSLLISYSSSFVTTTLASHLRYRERTDPFYAVPNLSLQTFPLSFLAGSSQPKHLLSTSYTRSPIHRY
jgi:hypothetical protein